MSGDPFIEDAPETRDEQAADWCMRLADGTLAANDRAAFDLWIAASENRSAFDDALLVWQAAEAVADRPEVIQARSAALDDYARANSQRWRRPTRRWAWPAGIAAAVLLALLGTFALTRPGTPPQMLAKMYETGIGERRVAVLDDGSKLSLDAATEVEVALHSDRRDLQLLSGRAKFDVAKDPHRPFTVRAGDKVIVATGTSFSVELIGGQVRVLLYEGHVDVLTQKPGAARPTPVRLAAGRTVGETLAPGEEVVARIAAPTATIAPTDVVRSLSWEGGQIGFEDEPLTSAAERMNRYSHVKLLLGDARVGSLGVNGVYTSGDTFAVVEGLTALYGVRATRKDGKITLYSR